MGSQGVRVLASIVIAGMLTSACGAAAPSSSTADASTADGSTASTEAVDSTTTSEATTTTSAPTTTTVIETTTTTAPSTTVAGRCTPADPDTESIWFLPEWVPGDTHLYVIETGRRRPDVGFAGTASTRGVVEVVSRGADGVEFVWELGATDLTQIGIPSTIAAQFRDILDDLPEQRVAYRLDENRAFDEVTNRDEILDAMDQTFDVLIEFFAEVEPSMVEAFEQSRELVDDDVAVLGAAEEVLLLHSFEGFELGVDERLVFDEPIPDLFGTDTLEAVSEIGIVELVDDDGCVLVEYRQTPTPESFLAFIESIMALSGGGQVPENPDDVDTSDWSIEYITTAQWDTATERFVSVELRSELAIDGELGGDSTRLVLVDW